MLEYISHPVVIDQTETCFMFNIIYTLDIWNLYTCWDTSCPSSDKFNNAILIAYLLHKCCSKVENHQKTFFVQMSVAFCVLLNQTCASMTCVHVSYNHWIKSTFRDLLLFTLFNLYIVYVYPHFKVLVICVTFLAINKTWDIW